MEQPVNVQGKAGIPCVIVWICNVFYSMNRTDVSFWLTTSVSILAAIYYLTAIRKNVKNKL